MAGAIDGLQYQTRLAAQAYANWCSLSREPETARREVFTASVVAATIQARQPLRVKCEVLRPATTWCCWGLIHRTKGRAPGRLPWCSPSMSACVPTSPSIGKA